jgi:hypothetical protein
VALHRYSGKKGLSEEGAEDAGNYAKSFVYTEAYLNAGDDWWGIPTLDWGSTLNGVCIYNKATANLVADTPLLLAEVKRLREAMKTMLDDMNNASPEEEIEYWLDTWKHWLTEIVRWNATDVHV